MTALERQTVRVFIADFSKCGTKAGFFRLMVLAFGLKLSALPTGESVFWSALCKRLAAVSKGFVPVRVRLSGLENIYSFYPKGVETLLRILRAAEEESPLFRAEVRIGDALWNVSGK